MRHERHLRTAWMSLIRFCGHQLPLRRAEFVARIRRRLAVTLRSTTLRSSRNDTRHEDRPGGRDHPAGFFRGRRAAAHVRAIAARRGDGTNRRCARAAGDALRSAGHRSRPGGEHHAAERAGHSPRGGERDAGARRGAAADRHVRHEFPRRHQLQLSAPAADADRFSRRATAARQSAGAGPRAGRHARAPERDQRSAEHHPEPAARVRHRGHVRATGRAPPHRPGHGHGTGDSRCALRVVEPGRSVAGAPPGFDHHPPARRDRHDRQRRARRERSDCRGDVPPEVRDQPRRRARSGVLRQQRLQRVALAPVPQRDQLLALLQRHRERVELHRQAVQLRLRDRPVRRQGSVSALHAEDRRQRVRPAGARTRCGGDRGAGALGADQRAGGAAGCAASGIAQRAHHDQRLLGTAVGAGQRGHRDRGRSNCRAACCS